MNRTILFVLLFSLSFFACKQDAKESKTNLPEVLKTISAEGLELPVYGVDALDYFLKKKDGKVHVVNFWATWCAPCVKEIPYFEKVNAEYSKEEVEVTLISLDFEHQLEQKLIPFVRKNLKSDVVVLLPGDENSFVEKVSKNWQTGAIPVTLIYNDNLSYFIEGAVTYDQLVEKIEQFKQ